MGLRVYEFIFVAVHKHNCNQFSLILYLIDFHKRIHLFCLSSIFQNFPRFSTIFALSFLLHFQRSLAFLDVVEVFR